MNTITSPPVTFNRLPSGREHVMLGTLRVAHINPHNFGTKVAFFVQCHLPTDGGPMRLRPATCIGIARAIALQQIAEWLDCAGELCGPLAVTVRAQALEEREVA